MVVLIISVRTIQRKIKLLLIIGKIELLIPALDREQ